MKSRAVLGFGVAVAMFASSSGAQQHITSIRTIERIAVYKSQVPVCAENMPPAVQYKQADTRWMDATGTLADWDDMYICAVQAALAGYAPAQTLLGRMYTHARRSEPYNREWPALYGSPEEAMYWFGKAAEAGDGQGAFEAGQLHEYGIGVKQDDAQALAYYQRAAGLGYAGGNEAAGKLQTRDARVAKFQAQQQAKADAGDAKAMRLVGMAYLNGDPFRTDLAAAKFWLEKAAEAGDARAQSQLGVLYAHGVGTEKDENKAADWLLRAAKGRIHDNDVELWNLYDGGKLDASHVLSLDTASAKGMFLNDFGVPMNFTKAKEAALPPAPALEPAYDLAELTRKAEDGDRLAQYNLGIVYLNGKGVSPDADQARKWLETVADQDADADMNLGDIYYSGKLSAPDCALAAKWYEAAGAMNAPEGAENAAAIYLNGGGNVPADPIKAYALALLAQQRGSVKGRSLAARLTASLSFEDRARAIVYLNRLLLAHIETF